MMAGVNQVLRQRNGRALIREFVLRLAVLSLIIPAIMPLAQASAAPISPTSDFELAFDGPRTLVICTASGMKTITLDEYGQEIPSETGSEELNCPICQTANHGALLENIQQYQILQITWENLQSLAIEIDLPKSVELNSVLHARAPPASA